MPAFLADDDDDEDDFMPKIKAPAAKAPQGMPSLPGNSKNALPGLAMPSLPSNKGGLGLPPPPVPKP